MTIKIALNVKFSLKILNYFSTDIPPLFPASEGVSPFAQW
jgi:hypothetical protein